MSTDVDLNTDDQDTKPLLGNDSSFTQNEDPNMTRNHTVQTGNEMQHENRIHEHATS